MTPADWLIVGALQLLNLLFTGLCTAYAAQKKSAPYDDLAIRSQLRELDADLDDLFDRFKRLTARKGVAARRDEQKNGAMRPGETPTEWKARMRRARNVEVTPDAT